MTQDYFNKKLGQIKIVFKEFLNLKIKAKKNTELVL